MRLRMLFSFKLTACTLCQKFIAVYDIANSSVPIRRYYAVAASPLLTSFTGVLPSPLSHLLGCFMNSFVILQLLRTSPDKDIFHPLVASGNKALGEPADIRSRGLGV